MAIEMSEPMRYAPEDVKMEMQDTILRRGGSGELARLVLSTNEYARDKGNENMHLRHALERLRAENAAQREELERTWHVLKDFDAHPGRTDDRLADCVRAALARNK